MRTDVDIRLPKISLGFMSYLPPDDAIGRLEFGLGELYCSIINLRKVVDRMLAISSLDEDVYAVSSQLDEIKYHAENFLNYVFEFRERLLYVLERLIGRKGAEQRDYCKLEQEMPKVARQFRALDARIERSVRMRNAKTHETVFHLVLYIGGDVWDPADALLDVASKPDSYHTLRETVQRELNRFLAGMQNDCTMIEGTVNRLIEEVRLEKGLS